MTEYFVRHAEPCDAEAIHRIFSHPSVYSGTLQLPFMPFAAAEKRNTPREGVYRLVAEADGVVVGSLTLQAFTRARRTHCGAIGIEVDHEWHGKGVGSVLMEAMIELADNWLNLERIQLEVFTDNAAGVRLYEKFGFKIEGTLRHFAFREGRFDDVFVMGRLKSEQVNE